MHSGQLQWFTCRFKTSRGNFPDLEKGGQKSYKNREDRTTQIRTTFFKAVSIGIVLTRSDLRRLQQELSLPK